MDAHASLRDSILEHVRGIDENTNNVIVTQLSLAIADLALQVTFNVTISVFNYVKRP